MKRVLRGIGIALLWTVGVFALLWAWAEDNKVLLGLILAPRSASVLGPQGIDLHAHCFVGATFLFGSLIVFAGRAPAPSCRHAGSSHCRPEGSVAHPFHTEKVKVLPRVIVGVFST